MKLNLKKYTAVILSAVLTALPANFGLTAGAAEGINVKSHTIEEIRSYISEHPYDLSMISEYVSQPDYKNAPYSPGILAEKPIINALNTLNIIRYVAGIDEVGISAEYNELAQAGALVNAVNNELSHTPDKPAGMSDALYQKGYKGTSSSNLAWASFDSSIADRLIDGWMGDSDKYNIECLGHRRWCINPVMKNTGFGNVGKYHAMYSFDNFSGKTDYYGVCWPAQIMPEGFFADCDPWSISMGNVIDSSAVKVTLTRKNDGKKWNFSNASHDGYFNVNNDGYGQPGCIIFRPDEISYKNGDSFEVNITGLKNPVSYTVDFVDVFNQGANSITESDLIELNNFLIKKEYKEDSISDLNSDGNIDVFDAVYARRKLIK